MKRTKFILLALVVALVLMGAGYAAWTQTFTINSTVDAGELFVKVSNTANTLEVKQAGNYVAATSANSPYLNTDINNLVTTTTESNKAGNDSTLSTLTYNLAKVYPGTRLTSSIKFENKGIMKVKASYSGEGSSITNFNSQIWQDIVINVNGTPVVHGSNAEQMEQNLANAIVAAVGDIETGADKTITITQELPISSGNATEQTSLNWVVQLVFEQYNAQ